MDKTLSGPLFVAGTLDVVLDPVYQDGYWTGYKDAHKGRKVNQRAMVERYRLGYAAGQQAHRDDHGRTN